MKSCLVAFCDTQNVAWPWRYTSDSLVYWVAGSCLDSGQGERHIPPLEKGSSAALHCAFSRRFQCKSCECSLLLLSLLFCFPQSSLFLLIGHSGPLPLQPTSPFHYVYRQWPGSGDVKLSLQSQQAVHEPSSLERSRSWWWSLHVEKKRYAAHMFAQTYYTQT